MKIAVITGASSGLGTEYVEAVKNRFGDQIDEYWLIARRKERLEEVAQKYCIKAKILPFDLTDKGSITALKNELEKQNPEIKILINNSGFGKLGYFEEIGEADNMAMSDLNVTAVNGVTSVALKFMKKGSFILNVCSIASFAPNPRMTVYCSTKAYILSFTKALRYELKRKGINVCAACPGPMNTEFLPVAGIENGNSKTFDTLPRVNPKMMAIKSLRAAEKGKCVYTARAFYKFYRFLAKITPHNLIMPMSKT